MGESKYEIFINAEIWNYYSSTKFMTWSIWKIFRFRNNLDIKKLQFFNTLYKNIMVTPDIFTIHHWHSFSLLLRWTCPFLLSSPYKFEKKTWLRGPINYKNSFYISESSIGDSMSIKNSSVNSMCAVFKLKNQSKQ